jgi:3',5'-nucleoside bisphosphate phosphatase
MKLFRADLHIHTVLSPCGDLEMSPASIVSEASRKGLDIIGITDHNTTRHCNLIKKIAAKKGIFVLQGAEITTKEEVHCLTFFENTDALDEFQKFIDANLPEILNNPLIFGDQVEVDENEMIIYEEKRLLTNAIKKSLPEVESFVHGLNGLFIPAHINRKKNSIYSQLGLLPENLNADALEVSRVTTPEEFAKDHPEINKYSLTRSSDAHYLKDIGIAYTILNMCEPSFEEIRQTLHGKNGRKIIKNEDAVA